MLKSKNILPINPHPYVRNSADNAFIDAIITNEKVWGDLKADISLPYENIEQWSIVAENAIIRNTDDRFEVFHSPTVQKQKKYIFRKFNLFDELMLKINYRQFTSYWDSIGIFVHDNINEIDDYTMSQYCFGRFCNNNFFTKDGIVENKFNSIAKNYSDIWLRVTLNKNVLCSFFSIDGIDWIEVHSSQIEPNNLKYIGIAFALNDNVYYNWLSNNFIQIRYNQNEAPSIDYVTYLKQNLKPYSVHPFLKTSEENWEDICRYNLSFLEFIQLNIDSGKYIMMWLNEYYLPDSKAYLECISVHECLIYGYENSKIYMMIISDGKPKCITADIDNVLNAWNSTDKSTSFFFLKYSPTYSTYNLDLAHIYRELVAFSQSKNTSLLYTHLVAPEEGVFGLDVYRGFVNDRECFKQLLSDLRTPYLLYEHNLIMKKRLGFLFTVINASHEATNGITELINRLVTDTHIALQLTIKNFLNATKATEQEILQYYTKICKGEEQLYQDLINVLLPHVNKNPI